MALKRKEIEDLEELVLNRKKKFVRYQEGAKLYSLGILNHSQVSRHNY